MKKAAVIVCLSIAGVSAQQASMGSSVDDTLLLLRQKEIEIQFTIERLSVDLAAAEKNWQNARSEASLLSMAVDSVGNSTSKSLAYWQHLKTLRIELENARLHADCIKKYAYLRKAYLNRVNTDVSYTSYWTALADSALAYWQKAESECQWYTERLEDAKLELSALSLHLAADRDSIEATVP
jgi:hypothetical protein